VSDPASPSPPGLNFAFVKIPAGKFTMGAPEGRGDRKEEHPAHEVHIAQDFCVGAFEITEPQWNAVLNGGKVDVGHLADGVVDIAYMLGAAPQHLCSLRPRAQRRYRKATPCHSACCRIADEPVYGLARRRDCTQHKRHMCIGRTTR
jgi:formylglycine-generating enzyme required for sulfatase activity